MEDGGWGVLMQWKPHDMDVILYCILHIEYCILNIHTLYYLLQIQPIKRSRPGLRMTSEKK